MYEYVLVAHTLWRWIVIAAGIAAIAAAGRGLWRGEPLNKATALCGIAFVRAVDLQFLMGASLYLVLSPLTNDAMNVADGLPAGSDLRFFGLYHGLIMTLAFIDVHVSASLIKRGRTDRARQRRTMLLYGQTLIVIVCTIPWWRPLVRF